MYDASQNESMYDSTLTPLQRERAEVETFVRFGQISDKEAQRRIAQLDADIILEAAGSHVHCPYCCGEEADYHTMCFYLVDDECTEA